MWTLYVGGEVYENVPDEFVDRAKKLIESSALTSVTGKCGSSNHFVYKVEENGIVWGEMGSPYNLTVYSGKVGEKEFMNVCEYDILYSTAFSLWWNRR